MKALELYRKMKAIKMKTIGIDGNEANIQSRVGVNMYAFELLCSIYQLQKEWKNKFKVIVYLKEQPLPDLPKATESWEYRVIPGSGQWILKNLTPHLLRNPLKLKLFFSPSHYIPPLAPMPRVCSIMDLGYLEFSGQFTKMAFWQLKWWSAYSILASKHLLTISQSSKDDIVRHYPFARDKITITYPGYDRKRFNTRIDAKVKASVAKRYAIVRPYVLYLSTLKPSKNVEGLLSAWRQIVNKHSEYTLVIAGKKGWMYDTIFDRAKSLHLEDKVVFTDFVDEGDKPGLIAGASIFVLPSYWEGFGLDPLYAMACGVPVVVSNAGSLPEVVGDAGIIVDPYNIDSIAAGIERVISATDKDYNKLVEKGLKQAEKFSWEAAARTTMEVFEKVMTT